MNTRFLRNIAAIYQRHFRDHKHERQFLSSISFFATFATARLVAYSIHQGQHFFPTIYVEGTHVHHLVYGIVLLLIVGYLWILQADTISPWRSRLVAVLYGVGAALTLDEFALWLNLRDVYWARQGRESIDAVILFGGLMLVGFWGGSFFQALLREFAHLLRRKIASDEPQEHAREPREIHRHS